MAQHKGERLKGGSTAAKSCQPLLLLVCWFASPSTSRLRATDARAIGAGLCSCIYDVKECRFPKGEDTELRFYGSEHEGPGLGERVAGRLAQHTSIVIVCLGLSLFLSRSVTNCFSRCSLLLLWLVGTGSNMGDGIIGEDCKFTSKNLCSCETKRRGRETSDEGQNNVGKGGVYRLGW